MDIDESQCHEDIKVLNMDQSPFIGKPKARNLNMNFGEEDNSINQDITIENPDIGPGKDKNHENIISDHKMKIQKFPHSNLHLIQNYNEFEKSPKNDSTIDEFNKEFSVFR